MQGLRVNIYQNARKVAGYTQEAAAEMLGISVRSLADYESGVRVPANDIVSMMVMAYNSQLLGIQHLREAGEIGRDILPDVGDLTLQGAVLTLIDAIYAFADNGEDRELIAIARDGVVDESERARFAALLERLNAITAAAMAVRCNRPLGG